MREPIGRAMRAFATCANLQGAVATNEMPGPIPALVWPSFDSLSGEALA